MLDFDFVTMLPLISAGAIFGIFFGAIPGLTSTAAVSLLLPFVYSMKPVEGMGVLLGAFCGGISGGAIPAALLNIPGTPSSLCTTFDAYPLSQKGFADLALGTALFASFWGGIISCVFLSIVSIPISKIALEFGPLEYMLITVMGMILSVRVEGKDKIKSALALCIGMFFSMVGTDAITGVRRLTFGNVELSAGINLLPFLIGVFAIPQVLSDSSSTEINVKKYQSNNSNIIRFPSVTEIRENIGLLSLSSLIGFLIGILPGVGGSMASIMSYFVAKRTSHNKALFGKGCIEGVIASEASNNAMTGGALITTLALGIPGEACTAVILGGMSLLGLRAGPNIFEKHLDVIYGIIISFIIANILILIFQTVGMNIFLRILSMPKYIINPIVIVFSVLGVYCSSNNYFDIYVMFFWGLFAYLLKKCSFSMTPMVMGFILCPMFEKYLRISVSIYNSPTEIFSRSLSVLLFIVTLMILVSFKFKGEWK